MFFRKRRKHREALHHQMNSLTENCLSLDLAEIDQDYMITFNPHRKSFELGLHIGSIVRVIRNNDFQRNIIIAVAESRYMISKDIAKRIKIKIIK